MEKFTPKKDTPGAKAKMWFVNTLVVRFYMYCLTELMILFDNCEDRTNRVFIALALLITALITAIFLSALTGLHYILALIIMVPLSPVSLWIAFRITQFSVAGSDSLFKELSDKLLTNTEVPKTTGDIIVQTFEEYTVTLDNGIVTDVKFNKQPWSKQRLAYKNPPPKISDKE